MPSDALTGFAIYVTTPHRLPVKTANHTWKHTTYSGSLETARIVWRTLLRYALIVTDECTYLIRNPIKKIYLNVQQLLAIEIVQHVEDAKSVPSLTANRPSNSLTRFDWGQPVLADFLIDRLTIGSVLVSRLQISTEGVEN